MLMADDRSSGFPLEEGFAFNTEEEEGEYGGDLSIEIGALFDILEEDNPGDTFERQPEDLSYVHAAQGSSMFITSYNDGPSESSGGSECAQRHILSEDGVLNTKLQLGSPVHGSSRSLTDGMPAPGYGNFCLDKDTAQNVPTSSLLDCIETRQGMDNGNDKFSFSLGSLNDYAAANTGSSIIDQYHDSERQFTHSDTTYSSENQLKKENELNVSMAAPRSEGYSGMEVDDRLSGYSDQFYSSSCGVDMVDLSYSTESAQFDSFSFDLNFLDGENKMGSTTEENVMHVSHNSQSMIATEMDIDDFGGQVPYSEEYQTAGGPSDSYYGQDNPSVSKVYSTYNGNVDYIVKKEMGLASLHDKAVMMTMKSFGDAAGLSHHEPLNLSPFGSLASNSSRGGGVLTMEGMYAIPESKRPRLNFDRYEGTMSGLPMARSLVHDHSIDTRDIKPIGTPVSSTAMHCNNLNRANGSDVSNSDDQNYDTGDDADLCVLEDISGPAQLKFSRGNRKLPVATQLTMVHSSSGSISHGHSKPKANREHPVFRAALEDLRQKLTEESPPEGSMAVPLLKHQRLALSWMVRKETAVSCPGGILADDQGLGKTVSTISLILKERSPPSVESSRKPSEPETLDLDDDDDDEKVVDAGKLNQGEESLQMNGISSERSTSARTNRRIAAGTLIVCPTSVLRQWSDELQNKVTKKANLSVLIYHGSNRTKDPYELAKFDVVLTTYAIVSMEVPKKPLAEEDDDDTKATYDSQMEFSSSKNRKYPPFSNKKSSKNKKITEVDMQNIRPLAAVGWFRVVLDEAQSIKNHRTQVARACWGLRAKRRWCLSGTPMQNTVDDLYSYFRFLKFDPYSSYKSFCSEIKNLIQRDPSNGFRKLQAVLKTVMLRRTKGTFLDGEPIINLPPKTVKLHKVEFSPEERDFYQTLEADSRAQFAEYAAAGTVQKNYVNILLMLLRLRQACDHPLLVKGFSLDSKSISSVEMVKRIPREKQLHLLQLYDASGSICGICTDPPEDAVITSCGHIFCNQCICEHLSGDDSHCPTANCKRHLKGIAVFSVAALKCSSFETPRIESNSDCSQSKREDISEHLSPGFAYDSSKIKAALEVLQSLKPHGDTRTTSPSSVKKEDSCESGPSKGSPGEKAIVFSQWTRMLDLLEDCLKKSSIQYRRLDGTMSVVARDKAVKDFNNLPEVSVMIMSLKAASLGLNMVAACHVLMLDLWWNPTTEDQAIDRAHRIGQTRPVTVLRLTVKDTVEDRILALQQKKREMVSSAFGDDEAGSRDSRLTVEDLNYLFS